MVSPRSSHEKYTRCQNQCAEGEGHIGRHRCFTSHREPEAEAEAEAPGAQSYRSRIHEELGAQQRGVLEAFPGDKVAKLLSGPAKLSPRHHDLGSSASPLIEQLKNNWELGPQQLGRPDLHEIEKEEEKLFKFKVKRKQPCGQRP